MKKYWILIFTVFTSFNILSIFVLFSTPTRLWVRSQIETKNKEVLSIVYGDLMNNGSLIKIIKSKTANGISLDFYSETQNGSRYLISEVNIPNATDGFFDHRGQAVQLAIVDLNGDGKMELLAPTFDKNLIAYLNPYHFSKEENGFVPFWLRQR